MAMSKSFSLFLFLICSSAIVGFSQGQGGGNSNSLPCVQKLLPCQPYLKDHSNPPASCCVPMKQIVATDAQCLCAVFNNPAILKGLNVTQEDGLNLAKACGANPDTSICKNAVTPNASPMAPTAPSASNNSAAAASPPKKNGASGSLVSQAGRYLSMAALFSSVVASLV